MSREVVAGTPGCEVRVRALHEVSLHVRAGEFVAVASTSIFERTMLLLCAAGLARVDSGAVIARVSRRYLRAAQVDHADSRELLLVDDADSPNALGAIARAHNRGATIVAATANAHTFARAGARIVTLRDGSLTEADPPMRAPRARVAERALR